MTSRREEANEMLVGINYSATDQSSNLSLSRNGLSNGGEEWLNTEGEREISGRRAIHVVLLFRSFYSSYYFPHPRPFLGPRQQTS